MNKNGIPEYAVLMAGGGGTRLWPLSRPGHPKQLLLLLGGKSLYALTIERLLGVFPREQIFVVSNEALLPLLRSHEPRLPNENYFCEPSPRNTAPAVVYALAELRKRAPKFLMACLPADHFIANTAEFHGLVQTAGRLADQGQLVTLGIQPSGPETGYGYLELGEELEYRMVSNAARSGVLKKNRPPMKRQKWFPRAVMPGIPGCSSGGRTSSKLKYAASNRSWRRFSTGWSGINGRI